MYEIMEIDVAGTKVYASTDIYNTYPNNWPNNGIVLVNYSGILDTTHITVETEKKLQLPGAYIVSESIGEREVTLEINAPVYNFISLLKRFENAAINFSNIKINLYQLAESGSSLSLQRLGDDTPGKITSITRTEVGGRNGYASLSAIVRFPDPTVKNV